MKQQMSNTEQTVVDQLWSTEAWVSMVIIAHGASQKAIVASKDLKLRYFGEARKAATPSQNSYNQKRAKAVELGVIAAVEGLSGAYAITDFGKAIIAYAEEKGIVVSELKSKAQTSWEARV